MVSIYSMPWYCPLLSWHSSIIGPINSVVTMISAFTIGSSIYSISEGSGKLEGLVKSITSPLVLCTLYTTPGAVVTKSRLYSRSSRSCMISKCSNPKKPQRNPKPRATEVSGSKNREASFNCSFSSASRKSPYLAPSAGYTPQNTMGVTFL